jgi:hypothetical protein
MRCEICRAILLHPEILSSYKWSVFAKHFKTTTWYVSGAQAMFGTASVIARLSNTCLGPPYICLHPFSSGFPIRIAHCSSRMPTEQERPGMYARSSKTPSRPQLILVTGKIVISRQAHEMGWDENHIDPRPTTETSQSRSVAQQGAPYRQERRVNLHATEDVPVTRVRPDPIRSQPISLPHAFNQRNYNCHTLAP